MPYVKLTATAQKRSNSKRGHNATNPNSSDVPTLTIADMLIQLTSHQQVVAAEIAQIEVDIQWLEVTNKRYADVRLKNNNNNHNSSPTSAASGSPVETNATTDFSTVNDRKNMRINNKTSRGEHQQENTIYAPNGSPITNAPPNTVAVACFTKQLKELRALKEERQAVLTEVRQHLSLYQLHAPSGLKLLNKVRKNLGTLSE